MKQHSEFLVEKYLQAGMDPNLADAEGNPALILASQRGFCGLAKTLLDHRADATQSNISSVTADVAAYAEG